MNRNYRNAYGWADGKIYLTMLMIFWCLVVWRCDVIFDGHCRINFMKRGNNAHFSTFNIFSWIIIVIIQLFNQMHLLDEYRQPYLYWMAFLRYCYFWYTLCMYFVYYWIHPNGLYMHVWLVFSDGWMFYIYYTQFTKGLYIIHLSTLNIFYLKNLAVEFSTISNNT